MNAPSGGGLSRPLSAKVLAVDANLMLAMDARRFLCAMQELTEGTLVATHQVMIEAWDKCTETSAKAAGNFVRHQFFEGRPQLWQPRRKPKVKRRRCVWNMHRQGQNAWHHPAQSAIKGNRHYASKSPELSKPKPRTRTTGCGELFNGRSATPSKRAARPKKRSAELNKRNPRGNGAMRSWARLCIVPALFAFGGCGGGPDCDKFDMTEDKAVEIICNVMKAGRKYEDFHACNQRTTLFGDYVDYQSYKTEDEIDEESRGGEMRFAMCDKLGNAAEMSSGFDPVFHPFTCAVELLRDEGYEFAYYGRDSSSPVATCEI